MKPSTTIILSVLVIFSVFSICWAIKPVQQVEKSPAVTYIIYDTDREAAAKLYEKIYQDTLISTNSGFKSEEAEKAAQHAVMMVYGKPKP